MKQFEWIMKGYAGGSWADRVPGFTGQEPCRVGPVDRRVGHSVTEAETTERGRATEKGAHSRRDTRVEQEGSQRVAESVAVCALDKQARRHLESGPRSGELPSLGQLRECGGGEGVRGEEGQVLDPCS